MRYLNLMLSHAHRLSAMLAILVLAASTSAFAQIRSELLIFPENLPVRLPHSAQQLVDFETRANPVATRSNQPFWIEHLEIPLRLLGEDAGLGLDKRIRDSMVFMKNGEQYVRWILNPEDTKYGGEMAQHLSRMGYDGYPKRHFIGYLTSSRSCIVQDPQSGVTFSIKSSTNQTAGNWKDKKESANAAKAGRLMSDYLANEFTPAENQALRVVKEPLAFSFQAADQAIIIRQYDHFLNSNQDRLLVPAFSVAHSEMGSDLARQSGSSNPAVFWAQNLMGRLGIALSELLLNFGITYNSPHGQNFLVEVDRNMRPTGFIYARDYADSNIQTDIMAARGGQKIIDLYRTFTQNSKFSGGGLWLAVNPYYSGQEIKPSWLPDPAPWKAWFIHEAKTRANELLRLADRGRMATADVPLSASARYGKSYWLWEGTLSNLDVQALTQSLRARARPFPKQVAFTAPPQADPPANIPSVVEPPRPDQALARVAAPFRSWPEFIDTLRTSSSLDGFAGRMEVLAEASARYDLKALKEAATAIATVGSYTISRKLAECTDPNAIFDIVNAFHQVHPLYIVNLGNIESLLQARQGSGTQLQRIGSHLQQARELMGWIENVRTGSLQNAKFAADRIRDKVHRPYQAVADALAYRLKREQDELLRSTLAITLANIGQGDEVVKEFLTKNSALIPDNSRNMVRELLNRSRPGAPPPASCSIFLRQAM